MGFIQTQTLRLFAIVCMLAIFAHTSTSVTAEQYYISKEKATWEDAVEKCPGRKGHLLRIETEEEDKQVHDFVRSEPVHKVGELIWTDGVSNERGKWVWNGNGDKVEYTHFETKTGPNGFLGFISLDDDNYEWEALYDSGEKHYYICEYA